MRVRAVAQDFMAGVGRLLLRRRRSRVPWIYLLYHSVRGTPGPATRHVGRKSVPGSRRDVSIELPARAVGVSTGAATRVTEGQAGVDGSGSGPPVAEQLTLLSTEERRHVEVRAAGEVNRAGLTGMADGRSG